MATPALSPVEKAKLREALGVPSPLNTALGVAAPAAVGAGSVVVSGKPTMWLWEVLDYALHAPPGDPLPPMPEDVGMFFGGLLLAAGYAVSRALRKRNTP